MSKKRVTMEDIANRLDISKYAVSLALSDKKGVSEITREKVVQVAQEMGYCPRPTHKALLETMERQGTIGVITSEGVLKNPYFFSTVLNEIEKEVRQRGYGLSIANVDINGVLPNFVKQKIVDGIIVISDIGTSLVNKLEQLNIPCVMVEHYEKCVDIDSIMTNNRQGVYLAIEYLKKQLKTPTIGFLGDIQESINYYERWKSFCEVLIDLGLKLDMKYCKIDKFSKYPQDPIKDIRDFIEGLDSLPDAFFCVNDLLAVVLSSMLIKKRIKIPEDVSIIGFDDTKLTEYNIPSLTMIHLYKAYYGRRAVEQLFLKFANRDKPAEIIRINTKLVIRNSVRDTTK